MPNIANIQSHTSSAPSILASVSIKLCSVLKIENLVVRKVCAIDG